MTLKCGPGGLVENLNTTKIYTKFYCCGLDHFNVILKI